MEGSMNREEIYKKIHYILVEEMKINQDKVNKETNFYEELGMDSISVVEFYGAMENNFEINIDNISEFINSLKSLNNVVEYVWNKLHTQKEWIKEGMDINE